MPAYSIEPMKKIYGIVFVLGILFGQNSQGQTKNTPLNGKWPVELNINGIGLVRSFINFEFEDSMFVAYTRKGADRDILGIWKSTLGRLFTKDFKHGALINITDGKTRTRSDTLYLSGIFRSALSNYYFKGTIHKGLLHAWLLNGRKEQVGTISGSVPLPPGQLSDYPALIDQVLGVTKEKIFNRSVFEGKEWKRFEKEIRIVSAKVQDDIEMEFAFFYNAGKLPFSHFSFSRPAPETPVKNATETPKGQVSLEEKSPETAYMKIKSFSGTAAEMDSIFSLVIKRQYKNLIVDLRGNSGGSVAAGLKFATLVADTAFYGGVFLTQKWFEKNGAPPLVKDYQKLPQFTEASFDLMIDGIHNQEGLCLKIVPEKVTYQGKLFILTDKVTGSTCEPIVYGFKQNKRAVIVGEKTAGGMLTGEFFEIKDGFTLMIPTADYYSADGYRIDQKGVTPNVDVDPAMALDHVLKNLITK